MFSDLVSRPLNWASDDPHLSGNFMPIGPEIEKTDLRVLSGKIPIDLFGVYMRNGPNPQFKPIAYNYPLDGDGMIHALYFDNGRARYKNRFVITPGLAAERRAGHAIYGSLMRPVPVDSALLGPDCGNDPFKSGAFINVMHHGDHLIALGEADTGFEMSMELDTLGKWTAGTSRPLALGAHNRRHPTTGELFAIEYTPSTPVVYIHRIDTTGMLQQTFPVNLLHPAMIHDFVLTERHIVLLVGPAIFDMEAARSGKPMLQWRPELGMRIGVISLDGSSATWLDADAFWVFHFANGYERGGQIVIDYIRHGALKLGYDAAGTPPRLHQMVIDLTARSIRDVSLGDFVTEFPRINDALEAMPSRYIYVPTMTETLKMSSPPAATFNMVVKVDSASGAVLRHDFGNRIVGEPIFIPRKSRKAEDDGYLGTFAYDPVSAGSQFVLLDAQRIDDEPIAVIALPQRVPQGLHGTWINRH